MKRTTLMTDVTQTTKFLYYLSNGLDIKSPKGVRWVDDPHAFSCDSGQSQLNKSLPIQVTRIQQAFAVLRFVTTLNVLTKSYL